MVVCSVGVSVSVIAPYSGQNGLSTGTKRKFDKLADLFYWWI